jgi:hypothetical protein
MASMFVLGFGGGGFLAEAPEPVEPFSMLINERYDIETAERRDG